MKKVIYLTLIALFVFSCDDNDQDPNEINRVFFENAELSHSDNPGVYPFWNKGEKTIFRFSLIHPDEPNISDDELTEHFWIEIPANVNQFSIDGPISGESNIEVYYTRACYCYIPDAFEFTRLNVSGEKNSNNEWTVSFDLTVESEFGTYELEDSGKYALDTFNHD